MPATSGAEEDEGLRTSRAYNNSIYLMLAVPYSLVGLMGYFVYRHLHARDEALAATLPPGTEPLPVSPGAEACPPPSQTAAISSEPPSPE